MPVSGVTALQALEAGQGAGGTDGAGPRCLRRRRQLRRTAGQGLRRGGDRRVPARPSSTWCGRWARTTSSTTPARTSPTVRHRYDLVIDIAGNPTLSRLRRALDADRDGRHRRRRGGRQLLRRHEPAAPGPGPLAVRAATADHVRQQGARQRPRAPRRADRGRLRSRRAIDRTYPLSRAPEAMRQLEAGHVRGKVAIRVRDPQAPRR